MKEGLFAVYKPKGISSHDLVNRVRKASGIKKVGHAGTLDPLAEGVLVIAVGREYTKKLGLIAKEEKEYLCEIKLGSISLTGDQEGPISKKSDREPSLDEIRGVLKRLTGKRRQRPHIFSAIKVNGIRSYHLARKGEATPLKAREVFIDKIEILSYHYPVISLLVTCGPGTYIRSLAEEIGELLETGAYLKSLKRSRVGSFKEENSIEI